jgi:hypothetical protein
MKEEEKRECIIVRTPCHNNGPTCSCRQHFLPIKLSPPELFSNLICGPIHDLWPLSPNGSTWAFSTHLANCHVGFYEHYGNLLHHYVAHSMAHPPHLSKTSKHLSPHISELPPHSMPTKYDFLDMVPSPVIGIVPHPITNVCNNRYGRAQLMHLGNLCRHKAPLAPLPQPPTLIHRI